MLRLPAQRTCSGAATVASATCRSRIQRPALRIGEGRGCINLRGMSNAVSTASKELLLRLFDAWGTQMNHIMIGSIWNKLGQQLRDKLRGTAGARRGGGELRGARAAAAQSVEVLPESGAREPGQHRARRCALRGLRRASSSTQSQRRRHRAGSSRWLRRDSQDVANTVWAFATAGQGRRALRGGGGGRRGGCATSMAGPRQHGVGVRGDRRAPPQFIAALTERLAQPGLALQPRPRQLQQFSLWCELELRCRGAAAAAGAARALPRRAARRCVGHGDGARPPIGSRSRWAARWSRLGLSPTPSMLAEGYSVDYALSTTSGSRRVDGPWHFARSATARGGGPRRDADQAAAAGGARLAAALDHARRLESARLRRRSTAKAATSLATVRRSASTCASGCSGCVSLTN